MRTWAEMVDELGAAPEQGDAVDEVLALARQTAATPIVRRVYSYEEVGQHRTWLDGRAVPLEPEIQQTFALAMSDCGTANTVAAEMPLLAAGYRLSEDGGLLERLVAQLEEVATWSPIQRHGWTCYRKGNLLAPGGDGNWLATGTGIRAIGDALEILPPGCLEAGLVERLHELLRREIASIVDDWRVERPWFVRGDNPVTNQWVLPTEGLVRACLILGTDSCGDQYEIGVANLMRALDAHGSAGEFEEGVAYATFTVGSLLAAARAMATAGDRRGLDHPFLRHFPLWMAHHLQPGRMGINCFDAGGMGHIGRDHSSFRHLLSLVLVCADHPVARWALTSQFDAPSDDLTGALASISLARGEACEPPPYALYERATRVNWRSSWDDDATGVWVRGGHELDQHDHQDRGHVSFVRGGVPLLIEAGTPSYDEPEMARLFQPGTGHNVLQVGTVMPPPPEPGSGQIDTPPGWQQPHGGRPEAQAPLLAWTLNAAGGTVSLDAGDCYEKVAAWERTVDWSAAHCRVIDEVELRDGAEDVVLFRWHLGTAAAAQISGASKAWHITWPGGECEVEGSAPLAVEQVTLPDRTLQREAGEKEEHTCLVVRTAAPVAQVAMAAEFR